MAKIQGQRSVDSHEQVKVRQHGDHKHSTHIVKDLNASRHLVVSRAANLIWFFIVVIEAMIGLRILLKLIAANPDNLIASLIYQITEQLLWPFWGLTSSLSVQDMVLEIPAIIAMFVYALVGWVLVKLVWLLFYLPDSRKVRIVDQIDQ